MSSPPLTSAKARSEGVYLQLRPVATMSGSRRTLAGHAAALMLLEVTLTQPDGLRRDFHQFIVINELHGIFERQLNRRHKVNMLILAGRSHVCEVVLTDGVHHKVVVPAMNADAHALLKGIVRLEGI